MKAPSCSSRFVGGPPESRNRRQPRRGETKTGEEALAFKSEIENRKSKISPTAFTLIELLVVISIFGILAGLTVPVIKHFGKSDATLSASRQLLDDVARARQLAMSQRTTVYMVFVPTNFWNTAAGQFNTTWWNRLTFAQRTAATNLFDKQLTGYTFVSLRKVGDQPGRGAPHYLAPWQDLPDGTFIALNKFLGPPDYQIANFMICGFSYTNLFPFPTEDTTNYSTVYLPYIAFNYLGRLTTNGDVFIPLARGSVGYAVDANKALQMRPPDVSEMPPGNSTNSAYNIVHIDRLTGRAVLEYQKMQ